jgi:hypothetical protein
MSDHEAQARFEVYGLGAKVRGDWPEVVEALRRDFAWFERDASGSDPTPLDVVIERKTPETDAFGPVPASLVTERNVVYRQPDRTVIDYLGRALSVLDHKTGRLVVQGEDGYYVRRAAFDFLLSRVGEHLDRRGLPRLHGLGLAGAQGGVLVTLPMGGGKTTLALRALRTDGVRFLSESSPLIDRRGYLHPFPFPLWVRTNSPEAADLPERHVRRIEGIDPDPSLLELSAFWDRIETVPQRLRHVVLGRRVLGRAATLERLPRRAAVGPFLRDSVIGLGFFQGIEFLLRGQVRSLVERVGTGARRGGSCFAGLAGADVWRLDLGSDKDESWSVLERLLR